MWKLEEGRERPSDRWKHGKEMLVSKQRAPGDRVLMRQFQTSLQMLAPDCVEKTNSQVFYYKG